MVPYRYTLKRIAKRWRSKNVVTTVLGLGFTIFYSVSSDNFLIANIYFIIFVTIDFCYSQLIFKKMKYSEKNEFIKERWGGPTFKLWTGSWGSTFKLWRVSWVLGSQGPGPTFTPCQPPTNVRKNFVHTKFWQIFKLWETMHLLWIR